MAPDIYDTAELKKMGIHIGRNARIHKTALFFGNNITIGDNVRIDCHAVISANAPVILGNHIHLCAGVYIFGSAGVAIDDYCNLAPRCSIFTESDDYTDGYMTNPMIPDDFRKVHAGRVHLKKHVIIGCGSVVLPRVTLYEGASVGALSLVNRDVEAYSVVAGTPIHEVGKRDSQRLSKIEKAFRAWQDER